MTTRAWVAAALVVCVPSIAGAQAPADVSGISTSVAATVGGKNPTAQVSLSAPAAAGGFVVHLSTNAPNAATVPATVTVAAGTSTVTFVVTTVPVARTIAVTVTATGGSQTRTAVLTVLFPAVASMKIPAHDGRLTTLTAQLALAGAAPAGGTVVLLSTDSARATVPAITTVPAGSLSADFTITVAAVVAQPTPVTIVASAGGETKAGVLTLIPPGPTAVVFPRGFPPNVTELRSDTVPSGASARASVDLTAPAPAGGIVVSLSSSNTAAATVPATVTIPQGATQFRFDIATATVAQSTAVTIGASAGGVRATPALLTVRPPDMAVAFTPDPILGGQTSTARLNIVPAAEAALAVQLSSSNPGVLSVPATVTLQRGETAASFVVTTTQVALPTRATITFRIGGVVWQSVNVTVEPRSRR